MTILLSTLVLWVFFIMVANLKNNSYENARGLKKYLLILFAAIFLIVDVAYNFTFGNILFWELADGDRKTLTARLKHILHSGHYEEYEWRFGLALFMCMYMIEPWDFGHCALHESENK